MKPRRPFLSFALAEPNSGCWLWMGAVSAKGYGTYKEPPIKKSWQAHRFSYQLLVGPIPDGLCVLHKCDTRSCVNPHHLFLGTEGDNNRDRDAKNRGAKGNSYPQAKLNPGLVRDIFYAHGTNREIAARFNVGKSSVSAIKRREAWSHIDV